MRTGSVAIRSLYLILGAAFGVLPPFLGVYLLTRGFPPAAIGLVSAAAAAVFALSMPVWGHVGDMILGRPRALQCAALGAALAGLALASDWPPLALGLFVVGLSTLSSTLGPLADSIAVVVLPYPTRDYGRVRMLQSLTFAAVVTTAGFAYNAVGYGTGTFLFAGIAVLIAVVVGFIRTPTPADIRPIRRPPSRHVDGHPDDHGRRRLGSVSTAFAVQPRLPLTLLTFALAYFGVLSQYTFLPLHIVDLGGHPSDVAFASGVSGLMEIPGTFFAAWAIRRVGLRGLYVVSAFGYGLALVGWAVAPTLIVVIALRSVTGFCFAGLAIGAVLTMRAILPVGLQATGQGLYQTVAFGLGAFCANLVGGVLFGVVGASAVFAVGALATFAAAFVSWQVLPASTRV